MAAAPSRPPLAPEGGCTCGGVRYRLTARPLFVHCCHCGWCRRETGSAFAVNALIESGRVEVARGAVAWRALPSASGSGQTVARCAECGLTLWSHYAGIGEAVAFVRAGTLDDPAAVPPDIHIYTAYKLPWVVLPEGVRAVPEYYRRGEHWPEESLARLAAARDA